MIDLYVKNDHNFDKDIVILKSHIRTRLLHVYNTSSRCINVVQF